MRGNVLQRLPHPLSLTGGGEKGSTVTPKPIVELVEEIGCVIVEAVGRLPLHFGLSCFQSSQQPLALRDDLHHLGLGLHGVTGIGPR